MIRISKENGIATLKLNRPEKRNALHPTMVAQIKSETVATTKLVVIDLNAVATPTEPSAVTVVHFLLVLQNSSLPTT